MYATSTVTFISKCLHVYILPLNIQLIFRLKKLIYLTYRGKQPRHSVTGQADSPRYLKVSGKCAPVELLCMEQFNK